MHKGHLGSKDSRVSSKGSRRQQEAVGTAKGSDEATGLAVKQRQSRGQGRSTTIVKIII